ncbi:MAG: DUF1549 domain-containing protein, partial [Bryobacteraceae bacterium]
MTIGTKVSLHWAIRVPGISSLLSAFLAATLHAQSPAQLEFFESKVRPVLVEKCGQCHNDKVRMGSLNLSSAESRAKVIHHRLLDVIGYEGKTKMPPSGKLNGEQIAAIRTWVEAGAPWPKEPASQPAALHWSFQPVRASAPPAVKNAAWIRNPIDRFILAKLEEKGLQPADAASKPTLLRRVTYDLTGMPPTEGELSAFLADNSDQALARVVDRLLASPRYGEKWGRHWLDVARYADSTGMDEDHIYPHAWRYRDYVIDAFNRDLPYDRFVTDQIAGDLLPGKDGARNKTGIIATGFFALGPKAIAQQDRVRMLYDVIDEQIDIASKAFIGLTVACARCHDHKFDPISTKDYYSLAGIFASTKYFDDVNRPGGVASIHYVPLDPAAYERYDTHRHDMYAKQMETEQAVEKQAADWYVKQGQNIAANLLAGEGKWTGF